MKLLRTMIWHLNEAQQTVCNDVIMGAMASQITSLTIVYSIAYSGADQRKHQSSTSLAFGRGIHRSPVNSPCQGSVQMTNNAEDVSIWWRHHVYAYLWDILYIFSRQVLCHFHIAMKRDPTPSSWCVVKSPESLICDKLSVINSITGNDQNHKCYNWTDTINSSPTTADQ